MIKSVCQSVYVVHVASKTYNCWSWTFIPAPQHISNRLSITKYDGQSLRRRQVTVMASQITGQSSVCSTIWQQRNIKGLHYCPFMRKSHRGQGDSPHVTRNMFPFDDVIMNQRQTASSFLHLITLYQQRKIYRQLITGKHDYFYNHGWKQNILR